MSGARWPVTNEDWDIFRRATGGMDAARRWGIPLSTAVDRLKILHLAYGHFPGETQRCLALMGPDAVDEFDAWRDDQIRDGRWPVQGGSLYELRKGQRASAPPLAAPTSGPAVPPPDPLPPHPTPQPVADTARLRRLLSEPHSLEEVADEFNVPPRKARDLLAAARAEGLVIQEFEDGKLLVPRDTPPVRQDAQIALPVPSGEWLNFGVVSDTHLGSKYCDLPALRRFYDTARAYGCQFVLHCGDLLDGIKVFRGQEYECRFWGLDSQVDHAARAYPTALPTKVLGGNHDESFLKSAGADALALLAARRSDIEYLGMYSATLRIGQCVIQLHHGAGGGAYAASYKLQKLINDIPGGLKPHLLFLGHYHSAVWLPGYRNIQAFLPGCFQARSRFITRLGLYPALGGWLIKVRMDGTSLAQIIPSWVPYYLEGETRQLPHD